MGPDLIVLLSNDRALSEPICRDIGEHFPEAEVQVITSAESLLGRLERFTADAVVIDERCMHDVSIDELSRRQPIATMLLLPDENSNATRRNSSVLLVQRDDTLSDKLMQHLALLGPHDARDYYLDVLEASEDGIFVTVGGRFHFVNAAFSGALSKPTDLLLGRLLSDFVPIEQRAWVDDELRRIATTGHDALTATSNREQEGHKQALELTIQGEHGRRLFEVSCRASVVRGRRAVVGVARDITAGQELADELDRARERNHRLHRLGELTAGAAHDFNNALTTIIGRLERLERQAGQNRSDDDDLGIALRAAKGATRIVRRVQNFARPDTTDANRLEVVNLTEVIRDAAAFLHSRLGNTTLNIHIPEPNAEAHVQGDAQELREVMVNLLGNALDAVGERGAVDIGCSLNEGRPMLYVHDNGDGMSPAVCARIFEPFFSTKGDDGSGLGLSVSRWILLRHGAEIDVQSEPGKGTQFRILFQHANTSAGIVQHTLDPQAPMHILVVDDDDTVGTMITDLLADNGHQVMAVSRAAEAATLISDIDFDLLLTDLDLKELNGWQLARQVRALRDNIVIGVMSGWQLNVPPDELSRRGVDFVMRKPFLVEDLLKKLKGQ